MRRPIGHRIWLIAAAAVLHTSASALALSRLSWTECVRDVPPLNSPSTIVVLVRPELLDEHRECRRLVVTLSEPAAEVRVEQRFETSLTVMDGGPHLDLRDWKHHTSPWVALAPVPGSPGTFLTRKIEHLEEHRFPAVSMAEVLAEVRRVGGERWVRVASEADRVGSSPQLIVLSRITYRIHARMPGGSWAIVQTVHVDLPMGC